MNGVDDVEDTTVMLEERVGSLEEENSLLLLRLGAMENAMAVLEDTVILLENVTMDLGSAVSFLAVLYCRKSVRFYTYMYCGILKI